MSFLSASAVCPCRGGGGDKSAKPSLEAGVMGGEERGGGGGERGVQTEM